MNYKELKIQFRAVSYAKINLEYRVDPNQDLTYEKTIGFWIFKFSVKRNMIIRIIPQHYSVNIY